MEELARFALVGTAKLVAASTSNAEHPADALVAKLGGEDREHAFLLQAGARAAFAQCGRVAVEGVVPPEPCPPESRPVAGPRLADILQSVLAADDKGLIVDILGELEAAGLLLPPELLPQVFAKIGGPERARLLAVVGERGRWLGQFNPDWNWVARGAAATSGVDRQAIARQWEEGGIHERRRAIEALRGSDPAEARALVQAAFEKEKAEHRTRLVESLNVGLSKDDEPFLESCLDDRSDQVRRAAAVLLARVPGSALAERMRTRAEAMLSPNAIGAKLKSVSCNPPEEIDKDWGRDGVPLKPPASSGKRAAWAEAVLAAVPPSVWGERFDAEPARLVAAVQSDDFAQAVLAGWTQAAAAFASNDSASAQWLRPLWDFWASVAQRSRGNEQDAAAGHAQTLLRVMSSAEAEAAVLPALRTAASADGLIALGYLQLLPRPWSAAFGRAYLATLQDALDHRLRTTDQGAVDYLIYQWISTFPVTGRALPREVLADALAVWKRVEAQTDAPPIRVLTREIDRFIETIQLRQRLCNAVVDGTSRPDVASSAAGS
ncbi:MAG: DUF5691 domain-containing protein [Planctomycetota bacterium]